jgi:hypothetical protein
MFLYIPKELVITEYQMIVNPEIFLMTGCCVNLTLGRFIKDETFDASSLFLCCLFSDAVNIPVYTVVMRFAYIMAVTLTTFIV